MRDHEGAEDGKEALEAPLDLGVEELACVEGLEACSNLRSLSLNVNRLRRLGGRGGLGAVPGLEELEVRENKLVSTAELQALPQLTHVSLGVNQLVTELKEGRDRVELLVSVGATRWEACGALVRQACVVANIPTINTLTVVGLVSIPGMMTGESPQAIAALTCPPSPSPPLVTGPQGLQGPQRRQRRR